MAGEHDPLRIVQQLVDGHLDGHAGSEVLDAGCGYSLPVELPADARLVGLDISPEALAKNSRLDSVIVGDIETYPLPREAFDVVLCWTVLEHLRNPAAAVGNITHALKAGGILVVGVPNVWSLKGIVTKLTPYRFHVWVYRRLFGYAEAGAPGFAPYPTYLRRQIAPRGLEALGRRLGLEPVYAESYGSSPGLPRALDVTWSIVTRLGRVLSLGAWEADAGDHVAVFRKPEPVS